MPTPISRHAYAAMYGPTTGDRLRLADTDLIIEVERDLTTYGEEVKFGGGKVIRDGMGQSQATRAEGAVDTVITNALIVDWAGIYKADVGLRGGRIAAIGDLSQASAGERIDCRGQAGCALARPGQLAAIGVAAASSRRRVMLIGGLLGVVVVRQLLGAPLQNW